MISLTEFLLARIAEDEEVARAMPFDSSWAAYPNETGQPIRAGAARIATCAESVMAHIARHDPDRVLAECEAKRRIVEEFMEGERSKAAVLASPDPAMRWNGELWMSATCRALQHLTLPYADHPDYREDWRP